MTAKYHRVHWCNGALILPYADTINLHMRGTSQGMSQTLVNTLKIIHIVRTTMAEVSDISQLVPYGFLDPEPTLARDLIKSLFLLENTLKFE